MESQSFVNRLIVDFEDIAPNDEKASPEQVALFIEVGQIAIPVGYLADERMVIGHNAEQGIHLVTHPEAFDLAMQTGAPRVSVILLPRDQALRVGEVYH